MIAALLLTNAIAWAGAGFLLSGSVARLLRGRERGSDDFLAGLSLISALLALFFARRITLDDQATFVVLCIMSLFLAAYVYRLGWGRADGR